MSRILEFLKFCLEYFYPSNSQEIDDEYYPSKKEMYSIWLDSQYLNGSWYIGEDLTDMILATMDREVPNCLYYVDGVNRSSLGFKINHLTSNQLVKVEIVLSNKDVYNYTGTLFESDKPYVLISLDNDITYDNIKKITISCDAIVENHIQYNELAPIVYNNIKKQLVPITGEEYDRVRREDIILQKLGDIQCINYKKTLDNRNVYGLRLKNIIPYEYFSDEQVLMIEQHYKDEIQCRSNSPSNLTYSICCSNTRPTTGITYFISLSEYGEYTGFKVKVIFNSVNGNSYSSPSSVEYIND